MEVSWIRAFKSRNFEFKILGWKQEKKIEQWELVKENICDDMIYAHEVYFGFYLFKTKLIKSFLSARHKIFV